MKEVTETKQPEIKTVDLVVLKAESDAIIVNVEGWRMRIFFDNDLKNKPTKGQLVTVKYTGDINDAHSVVFENLAK